MVTDTISDMLTRIRNANMVKHQIVQIPETKMSLAIAEILREAGKHWDGGYALAGMIGNGDCFVTRDPEGIRPAYYFKNDEVMAVASERVALMSIFDQENGTYNISHFDYKYKRGCDNDDNCRIDIEISDGSVHTYKKYLKMNFNSI